jgi:CBS domain-containing protein
MKLRELMTTQVSTVAPSATVVEAARIMRDINVGSVPVCEDRTTVTGVITDRDIVLHVVAAGKDPHSVAVRDVMSRDVITGSPDMDAHEAADLMAKHQIRRLPVVENGRLVGIVAIGDLATVKIHVDEAGNALSEISEKTH